MGLVILAYVVLGSMPFALHTSRRFQLQVDSERHSAATDGAAPEALVDERSPLLSTSLSRDSSFASVEHPSPTTTNAEAQPKGRYDPSSALGLLFHLGDHGSAVLLVFMVPPRARPRVGCDALLGMMMMMMMMMLMMMLMSAPVGVQVTLSIFPGIMASIVSVHNLTGDDPHPRAGRLYGDLFTPFLFLLFNLFDLAGRLLSGYCVQLNLTGPTMRNCAVVRASRRPSPRTPPVRVLGARG